MEKSSIEAKRHSLAHLLAAAVGELYPKALRTIGPAVDDGFYYDFDFGEQKIAEGDLAAIEAKMRELGLRNVRVINYFAGAISINAGERSERPGSELLTRRSAVELPWK